MKGFVLGLALKQRRKATWKSPIDSKHQAQLFYYMLHIWVSCPVSFFSCVVFQVSVHFMLCLPSRHFPLNITLCSNLNLVISSCDEKFNSLDTALHFKIFFGTRAVTQGDKKSVRWVRSWVQCSAVQCSAVQCSAVQWLGWGGIDDQFELSQSKKKNDKREMRGVRLMNCG